MMYIYAADCYCDKCGESIRERLASEGFAPNNPDDEYTYDSEEYPKGPYDDKEEADYPKHCGSREDCLDPHYWSDGTKSGYFFGNSLTTDGENYVKEMHRDRPTEVTRMWMNFYNLKPEGYPMYQLTLTWPERKALTSIGTGYAISNIPTILCNCLDGNNSWYDDVSIIFNVPEYLAWDIYIAYEDDGSVWNLLGPELTRKLDTFISNIV